MKSRWWLWSIAMIVCLGLTPFAIAQKDTPKEKPKEKKEETKKGEAE